MNLEQLRQEYVKKGLTLANAEATICQDIILNKIAKSSLNRNVTIKGGVVMYGISNDKRRATRDIDLDFIKYSLDDKAIEKFVEKLNILNDGISIIIVGKPQMLHHQDYNGKRIDVVLNDEYGFSITTKLDIGVNNMFNIDQEEVCFNLDVINEKAVLLINSPEQIVCEKLKSLLKFGIRSTRYKDIFDFYYLINNIELNINVLVKIIDLMIVNDKLMRENSITDVINDLKIVLTNKDYLKKLKSARNNWLEIPTNEVVNNIMMFFESLQFVKE